MSEPPINSIDIITAVGREDRFLRAAGESVVQFQEASGARCTWWLSSDGPSSSWIRNEIKGLKVDAVVIPPREDGHPYGPARTRNRAASNGDGPVIIVLDSDDLILPGMVNLYERFMSENVMWACGSSIDLDVEGQLVHSDSPFSLDEGIKNNFLLGELEAGRGFPFHCCSTIARRSVVEVVGGWDTSKTFVRGEDVAMWARITRRYPGLYTHEVVHAYRANPDSLISAYSWPAPDAAKNALLNELDSPEKSSGNFVEDLRAMTVPFSEGFDARRARLNNFR